MTTIRECFVPRFGKDNGFLVEFDFRQLEICALAEITKDPILITELNNGEDIHRLNAAIWLRKHADDVTDSERTAAKGMSFQLQYGARAPKMSSTLGISEKEAQAFIDKYYLKYRHIRDWHNYLDAEKSVHEKVMNHNPDPEKQRFKYAPTPTGRIYTLKPKQSKRGTWYYSSTEIKNYPIQGFGTGDIVPIVINMVFEYLYKYKLVCQWIHPINTVHDSFMFDCEVTWLLPLLRVVEQVFTDFPQRFKDLYNYDLKVQYDYDVKFGPNWASKDMTKLTRPQVQELLV